MTRVQIHVRQRDMNTYVVTPGSTLGPWPGVVVVHDGTGMIQDARNQCDWLAAAGYLAAAPDDRMM